MQVKNIPTELNQHSLQNALVQFKEHMQNVYKTGQVFNLVPAFIPVEKSLFENKDIKNPAEFKVYSRYFIHNDPSLDQMENLAHLKFEDLNRADFYTVYSHILVFQHALEYPELRELVLDICKELVSYSIEINSSNELFFDDEQYFGISILTTLAHKYPEYCYLVGEFIARDSDYDQVKYYVASSVNFLIKTYGYSRDILKMLACIRFNDFFIAMVESDYDTDPKARYILFKYLSENKDDYDFFKQSIVDAFIKYPQSLKPDFEDKQTLIQRFFEVIVEQYDTEMEALFEEQDHEGEEEYESAWDNQDEFKFHDTNLEQEIEDLDKAVFEAIKDIPRKNFYYSKGKNYGDETLAEITEDRFYGEYEAAYDYEMNNEFFLTCFDNGQDILDYIEKGENEEVLGSLEKVHIRKLSFENRLQMYKRLEYFGSGDFRLSNDIEDDVALTDILEHFIAPYLNPDSYNLEDQDEQRNLKKAIRCFKVLVKLTGKNQFSPADIEEICDNLELMTEDQLLDEFETKEFTEVEFISQVYALINDAFAESFGQTRLRSIHRLFQKNPVWFTTAFTKIKEAAVELQDPEILAVMPKTRQKKYAMGSQLLAVAFVIYNELQDISNMNNPELMKLIDYYQENIFETLIWQIEDNETHVDYHQPETKAYLNTAIEQLNNYFNPPAPQIPPKELMQKLMKEGIAALSEEEQALIQSLRKGSSTPGMTDTEAEKIIEMLLVNYENTDVHNEKFAKKRNSLFHSKNAVMALSSIPWVARVAPAQVSKGLLKAYRLFLDSAPTKLLYSTFKEFTETTYIHNLKVEEMTRFEDMMLDLKIPRCFIFATQILVLEKKLEYGGIESLEEDESLKKYYFDLVEQFSEMDEVDEDESPMFGAMERKRKEAMKNSFQYLEVPTALKFLKQINKVKESTLYLELAQLQFREDLWQASKKNIRRLKKSYWEFSEEEKQAFLSQVSLVTDKFYIYFWEDYSLDNLMQDISEHFQPKVDLDIAPVAKFCFEHSEEMFKKCFQLIFAHGNEGDFEALYDAIKSNLPRSEKDSAIYKFDTWAEQLNVDKKLLFKFYLNEHKSRTHLDFEDNSFAQIILKRFPEVELHTELKQSKAYKVFIKLKDQYETLVN